MMISVILPVKNDFDELYASVSSLLATTEKCSEIEIVIVNDGSTLPSGRFRPLEYNHSNVKVINTPITRGVGYSFDRGVENCSSENIVLMGCDVTPHEGWYDKVRNAIIRNPNTIGCAVCVGDKPNKNGGYNRYYGADMLITMDKDDLPQHSKLRDRVHFTDIFRGRWRSGEPPKEVIPISCLMGAFYWTTKSYYQRIGGWDTEPGERWQGQRRWGTLEPYLSLKSWLVGGGCYLYKDIEATHIFNRKGEHRFAKGARSLEDMWWNKLFLLETCVFDSTIRKRIYDFVHPELNYNIAKKLIVKNYDSVSRVRLRNESIFMYSFEWFVNEFRIKIK